MDGIAQADSSSPCCTGFLHVRSFFAVRVGALNTVHSISNTWSRDPQHRTFPTKLGSSESEASRDKPPRVIINTQCQQRRLVEPRRATEGSVNSLAGSRSPGGGTRLIEQRPRRTARSPAPSSQSAVRASRSVWRRSVGSALRLRTGIETETGDREFRRTKTETLHTKEGIGEPELWASMRFASVARYVFLLRPLGAALTSCSGSRHDDRHAIRPNSPNNTSLGQGRQNEQRRRRVADRGPGSGCAELPWNLASQVQVVLQSVHCRLI